MAHLTRRTLLFGTAAAGAAYAAAIPEAKKRKLLAWLEGHRRENGGYGFELDSVAHISPTFGVVGTYSLLGIPVPDSNRVASFARDVYPVPERRRTERPLWRLDYEQVQTLLWLGEPVSDFRDRAATWTGPADFTKAYEFGGNPVLQHQAMAVRVRQLVGLPATDAWRIYFEARRRKNGTYNNTPAADGSGGHILNALWGLTAAEDLGIGQKPDLGLGEWVRACQLPSGGFTWSPDAHLGAGDDVFYTWAALQILAKLRLEAPSKKSAADWIASLQTSEGGYQDRPGGEPNPVATFYALDSLRLLDASPDVRSAPRAKRTPITRGTRIFLLQIQAPGGGSPAEAVALADAFGIGIWAAKNSPEGWVEEAARVAREQNSKTLFAPANEEYGTFVTVDGLGTYSHLSDLLAPPRVDFGPQLPKKQFPYPWAEFRDTRIGQLRRAGGSMVWQFNENEELTRILLDEAAEKGTYGSIASFHFGNENFLHSQPFLARWNGRLPFVSLQDAHATEPWWWGDQLGGLTTLFLADELSWRGWQQALERNHVVSVRHDVVTSWKTQFAGGTPEIRDYVRAREKEWRWWNDAGAPSRRLPGILTVVSAGARFEAGAPEKGAAVRLRLWSDNSTQGVPKDPRVELLTLQVDGTAVEPRLVNEPKDRYYIHAVTGAGKHTAVARLKNVETQKETEIRAEWENKS